MRKKRLVAGQKILLRDLVRAKARQAHAEETCANAIERRLAAEKQQREIRASYWRMFDQAQVATDEAADLAGRLAISNGMVVELETQVDDLGAQAEEATLAFMRTHEYAGNLATEVEVLRARLELAVIGEGLEKEMRRDCFRQKEQVGHQNEVLQVMLEESGAQQATLAAELEVLAERLETSNIVRTANGRDRDHWYARAMVLEDARDAAEQERDEYLDDLIQTKVVGPWSPTFTVHDDSLVLFAPTSCAFAFPREGENSIGYVPLVGMPEGIILERMKIQPGTPLAEAAVLCLFGAPTVDAADGDVAIWDVDDHAWVFGGTD